jgi:hypothetical protein
MMGSIAPALFTRSRAERAMVNIGVMMVVGWLGAGEFLTVEKGDPADKDGNRGGDGNN